ncbi:GreA/GreB family elongation factor [Dyadobacter sp. CY323]|uniref:GreA/GreB family elongation factor n=1 Tax=Dyadobacter sp. CY323 TaxID=2907302 RepID=UPI001F434338|nr:GreA/GreB family elongation factor [Dyadobacter sp. CY323]MCE6990134.1 GreA/GreB family elongation factor [Dyadobacter sp. CY323]
MEGNTPIILRESDFRILKRYVAKMPPNESTESILLYWDLRSAIVVEDEILPENCVRLNSTVKVKEWASNQIMEFSIVTPELANSEKRRISFLDPLGAAFIGLCKMEKIEREIYGNTKCFKILDVRHPTNQVKI